MELKELLKKQKNYFFDGNTLNIDFRRKTLINLKNIISENEEKILEALNKDLRKSNFESYLTEVGLVYDEINLHIKNIHKYAKRERLKNSIMFFPSSSYLYKEPYGNVLIIGPFNYPFQLVLIPLIGAISAGNTVIIKPSEHSTHISNLLEEIINNNFDEEYIKVVGANKGKEIVTELLEMNFDYIFFTGSTTVGKIVMEKAAKRLIPITLELGGKSPCIVDKDANLEMAAKRIVWGKLLNCGQTCIAPDYLYVHKDIKNELLTFMVKEIHKQYGDDLRKSEDYTRIISSREIKRLSSYLEDGYVFYGGKYNEEELFFEPTILTNIKENSRILNEEIFGPILPVLEFAEINEVIDYVNNRDKPLAMYYFSESKEKVEDILKRISSGGATINDVTLHGGSCNLPFGGVGPSGVGAYHGKYSFDVFTHKKGVINRKTFMELPIRFAPFNDKIKLLRKFMK